MPRSEPGSLAGATAGAEPAATHPERESLAGAEALAGGRSGRPGAGAVAGAETSAGAAAVAGAEPSAGATAGAEPAATHPPGAGPAGRRGGCLRLATEQLLDPHEDVGPAPARLLPGPDLFQLVGVKLAEQRQDLRRGKLVVVLDWEEGGVVPAAGIAGRLGRDAPGGGPEEADSGSPVEAAASPSGSTAAAVPAVTQPMVVASPLAELRPSCEAPRSGRWPRLSPRRSSRRGRPRRRSTPPAPPTSGMCRSPGRRPDWPRWRRRRQAAAGRDARRWSRRTPCVRFNREYTARAIRPPAAHTIEM